MDEEVLSGNEGKYEVWQFPALQEEVHELYTFHDLPDNEAIENGRQINTESSIEQTNTEQECLELKENLHNKIRLIDEIHEDMKQLFNEINEDLLQKITSLMQKVVYKIIKKELVADKKILLNMIQTTLSDLEDHKHCEVLISREMYQQFDAEDWVGLQTKISVCPELTDSDYKIKTDIGEIIAILEDRLTAFFG